jgi:hypothetical protein
VVVTSYWLIGSEKYYKYIIKNTTLAAKFHSAASVLKWISRYDLENSPRKGDAQPDVFGLHLSRGRRLGVRVSGNRLGCPANSHINFA